MANRSWRWGAPAVLRCGADCKVRTGISDMARAASKSAGGRKVRRHVEGDPQKLEALPRSDVPHFTHFDAGGQAHMVDVGAKAATRRIARAGGRIVTSAATFGLIVEGTAKKGDVLGVARIAAIQAAKRTAELIPLCHPLALTRLAVDFTLDPDEPAVSHRSDRRDGRRDRRGDGGAHWRECRPADDLRHVQGGRPVHAPRGRAPAREKRRQVRTVRRRTRRRRLNRAALSPRKKSGPRGPLCCRPARKPVPRRPEESVGRRSPFDPSADRHRHEYPRLVALHEQGDRLAGLVDDSRSSLDGVHRRGVDRQDHVARLHARAFAAAPPTSSITHAVSRFADFASPRLSAVARRRPSLPPGGRFAVVLRHDGLVVVERADVAVTSFACPSRQTSSVTFVPGRERRHQRRQTRRSARPPCR